MIPDPQRGLTPSKVSMKSGLGDRNNDVKFRHPEGEGLESQ